MEEEVQGVQEFSFVVANARFLLDEEEHLAEVLRERRRFFKEQGKKRDFWVVPEPAFLSEMPEVTAKLARPAAAVVSTDHEWITYVTSSLSLSLARTLCLSQFTCTQSINHTYTHSELIRFDAVYRDIVTLRVRFACTHEPRTPHTAL